MSNRNRMGFFDWLSELDDLVIIIMIIGLVSLLVGGGAGLITHFENRQAMEMGYEQVTEDGQVLWKKVDDDE